MSGSRYGGRLLSFHEYNTTQFFVVFVAIVLGAQSTGMFLAHASGTHCHIITISMFANPYFSRLDLSKGASGANAIFSMQQTIPKYVGLRTALPEKENLPANTPLIEFKNARFAYPSQPTHPVLRGFDMTVRSHRIIGG
jgi:ATP-binding cassette subfamily B (MDR/TAP) protein 1